MTQDAEMTALFASLYRATSRQSLFDIEAVLAQLEAMPKTHSQGKLLAREQLRCFIGDALVAMERQLCELRTRYAALPELETRKAPTEDPFAGDDYYDAARMRKEMEENEREDKS